MNATLMNLTARHLLGRRRTLVMLLLALLPVAVALIYRLTGAADETLPDEFAPDFYELAITTSVLPLLALVFGTGALGAEIEDGTAIYLLAKPISRWRIVATKMIVASAVTVVFTVPATLVSGIAIYGGLDSLVVGYTVGVAVGAITYATVFVAVSAVTSRALVVGMAYVFVWEAFITTRFSGLRWVSVREYIEGVAGFVADAKPAVLDPRLDGIPALIAAVVVCGLAYVLGSRALDRFEIGERA